MAPAVSTFAPWSTPDALEDRVPEGVDDAEVLRALQIATDVLFQFTGRQWPGVVEHTVRPGCGCVSTSCGCDQVSELVLPQPPIVEIVEVVIEGVALDPSEYRVDNSSRLVRLRDAEGNRQTWPNWQDWSVNSGDRTWSVKYRHGAEPPVGGVVAAEQLALQFLYGWSADANVASRCALPKRVTTVTRQGMSFALLDPLTLFNDGRTGIGDVDLWLSSVRYGTSDRRPGAVIDVAGEPFPTGRRGRRLGGRRGSSSRSYRRGS